MAEEKLMTAQQFNQLTYKWSQRIKLLARGTLATGTHSSGNLSKYLTAFTDRDKKNKQTYKVKFYLDRYGVFRAYGAGRGYIVINGKIMRGHRIVSTREISQRLIGKNDVAQGYLAKGYTLGEVKRLKVYDDNDTMPIARTPLDWIDKHIDDNIEELAGLVQEYYGDKSLRDLLLDFQNIKIKK